MFVGADFDATNDLTVSSLFVQSTPYTALYQVPDNIAAVALRDQPISSLVKLGINRAFGKSFSAGVSYGLLSEAGQTLGMRTNGAFSLGDVNFTHIGDVNLNARVAADTSVSLFAEQSVTEVSGAGGSLFRAGGTWSSSKYGIGLTRSDLFSPGDLVQLKVTRSLQIDSGTLALHVPVGRELDGTVNYEDRSVPLGLDRNPMEIGFAYLGGTRTFSYGTQLSVREDRFSGGRIDDIAAVGAVRWSF
jgi:hypothetical protein